MKKIFLLSALLVLVFNFNTFSQVEEESVPLPTTVYVTINPPPVFYTYPNTYGRLSVRLKAYSYEVTKYINYTGPGTYAVPFTSSSEVSSYDWTVCVQCRISTLAPGTAGGPGSVNYEAYAIKFRDGNGSTPSVISLSVNPADFQIKVIEDRPEE